MSAYDDYMKVQNIRKGTQAKSNSYSVQFQNAVNNRNANMETAAKAEKLASQKEFYVPKKTYNPLLEAIQPPKASVRLSPETIARMNASFMPGSRKTDNKFPVPKEKLDSVVLAAMTGKAPEPTIGEPRGHFTIKNAPVEEKKEEKKWSPFAQAKENLKEIKDFFTGGPEALKQDMQTSGHDMAENYMKTSKKEMETNPKYAVPLGMANTVGYANILSAIGNKDAKEISEQAQKNHPYFYNAGTIAGFLMPGAVVDKGVGKVAGKLLPKAYETALGRLAMDTGTSAVSNALVAGASDKLNGVSNKDTLKDMGEQAVAGVAFTGAGKLLGKGITSAAKKSQLTNFERAMNTAGSVQSAGKKASSMLKAADKITDNTKTAGFTITNLMEKQRAEQAYGERQVIKQSVNSAEQKVIQQIAKNMTEDSKNSLAAQQVHDLAMRAAQGDNVEDQLKNLYKKIFQDKTITTPLENEVQEAQKAIRGRKIYVGKDLTAANDFSEKLGTGRKNFWGQKIYLTDNPNDMSVDQHYEELSGMFPDLFPSSIINPADQANRILEVSRMRQKVGRYTDIPENWDSFKSDFDFISGTYQKAMENMSHGERPNLTQGVMDEAAAAATKEPGIPVGIKQALDSTGKVEKGAAEAIAPSNKEIPSDVRVAASLLNRKVVVADNLGPFDGMFKNGTIYIASDAEKPAMVIFKHEMTHDLQLSAPAEYTKLRDFVKQEAENSPYFDEFKKNVMYSYEQAGQKLSENDFWDEFTAQVSENFLVDHESIQRLTQREPNVAKRIYNWIKEKLHRAELSHTRYYNEAGSMMLGENVLEKAEKLYRKALKSAAEGKTEGKARFSGGKGSLRESVFDNYLQKQVAEKDTPKYSAQLKEKPETEVPGWVKESDLIAARRKADYLGGQLNRFYKGWKFTDDEKKLVDDVLNGRRTVDDLKKIPEQRAYTLTEAVKREKELMETENVWKNYNISRREHMDKWMQELLDNSDHWKDKSKLAYGRETWDRNIVDIAGEKEGRKIIDAVFSKIHDNEAARFRYLNEMRDTIRGLSLTKEESEMVQLVGEGKKTAQQIPDGMNRQKILKAVDTMRGMYDNMIDAINEALVRNGYAPIYKRADYFPHFDGTDTLAGKIKKALGIDMTGNELPTDINGLTHQFRPGKRYFANLNKRMGNKTTYDAVQGFDRYIEGASHVIYHTDDIQRMRAFNRNLRAKYSEAGISERLKNVKNMDIPQEEKDTLMDDILSAGMTKLSNAASDLEDYTQVLAGKKSMADRSVESLLGRKVYNIASTMENRIAGNMVAVNPASWITNFVPLTQTLAKTDIKTATRAMIDTVKSVFKDDGFVGRSTFLTNRFGSERLVKTGVQRAGEIASAPMKWIDQFTTETIARARYYDLINKGMAPEKAMKYADEWAAKAVGDRSVGAQPTLFNVRNPFMKIITQFQLEVNNQLSFLFKDFPRDFRGESVAKITATIAKMALYAYAYDQVYETLTGRQIAIDPISMATGFYEDATGKRLPIHLRDAVYGKPQQEKGDLGKAVKNLGKNVANNIPFIAAPAAFLGVDDIGRLPISAAIPNIGNMTNPANAAKELEKPAAYMLPPFGGGQAKKVLEAVNPITIPGIIGKGTIPAGGEYGTSSSGTALKFPVTPNAENTAKALLFGKWALPQAQNYINNGFKGLSVKDTQKYERLVEQGLNRENVYTAIKDINALQPNIDESGVSKEQKLSAIQNMKNFSESEKEKLAAAIVYGDAVNDEKRKKLVEAGFSQSEIDELMEGISQLQPGYSIKTGKKYKSVTASQKRAYILGYTGTGKGNTQKAADILYPERGDT